MSSFQDFSFFLVHKNPEAEAQRSSVQEALNYKTERESIRIPPFGLCLRRIVNEKTTSSVLSLLLACYLWLNISRNCCVVIKHC